MTGIKTLLINRNEEMNESKERFDGLVVFIRKKIKKG